MKKDGPEERPLYRFHIAEKTRRKYGFAQELFSESGNVIFMDVRAARLFTQKMNDLRRAAGAGETLTAGDMNAMGLIDEVLHYVTGLYVKRTGPDVFLRCLDALDGKPGRQAVDRALTAFLEAFPVPETSGKEGAAAEWLLSPANRAVALEELLHIRLANENRAFDPFKELFADGDLGDYTPVLDQADAFFKGLPPFGPDAQDLVAFLRAPAAAAPRSLSGQLEFIRTRWGHLLGDLLLKLLLGLDLIKEEEKLRFGAFQPGPPEVYDYAGQYAEVEAFSADKDWMPNVVMLAKNALVWLDQLSRRYSRRIATLDAVPDEELDRLASRGFTALWLIGVWERSGASRGVKRAMGNPEAEASAYSLFDYQISGELGGEGALVNLRGRAARRGIRLASDMVPNHTGIDSRWMIEHPDRFLTYPRPYPPFPAYSFNGPNLASDPRVGIFLEDHYYTKSDAAVVFKRVDFHTGDYRFIYHGNDGTHMPWNDTAQLDFLNPETREAVIRTILHVASLFPIIRFDAAMTLTKKHFQRLWFPEPGRGGDIPSRAECGISKFDFDHAMPKEFWREVVDRVAAEAPDTLLLAEAFWLLEGFFVRTLGMHRVYNSAFMNMLKTEDNAGYRQTVKNTLEFDPEVLKRFVNFMSNPDEETAIAQFGDGDKYFGVCTLMATMPGLPMFAHGQIEGFREKYGMEFRRAYWDESAADRLVERHEREIFPLLKKRWLFSGVENFLLYDLYDPGGWVNEDVYAYSNRRGGERALVVYNNRYAHARGWIRTAAAFAVKTPSGKQLASRTLAEGLELREDGSYVAFRDWVSGMEYLRPCGELQSRGMLVDLAAFQRQVFMDFRDIPEDGRGRWGRLCNELDGRGVPSVDRAFREMDLRPVLQPFRDLVSPQMCSRLVRAAGGGDAAFREEAAGELAAVYRDFARGARERTGGAVNEEEAAAAFRKLASGLCGTEMEDAAAAPALLSWAALMPMGTRAAAWLDEWMLGGVLDECSRAMGRDPETARRSPALVALLLESGGRGMEAESLARLLRSADAETFLRVNPFEGVRWFHKESLGILLDSLIAAGRANGPGGPASGAGLKRDRAAVSGLAAAAGKSGYRWDGFLAALEVKKPRARKTEKKPKPARKKGTSRGKRA